MLYATRLVDSLIGNDEVMIKMLGHFARLQCFPVVSIPEMRQLSLYSAADVQLALSAWIQARRKTLRLSRLLFLWQCVDDLGRVQGLTDPPPKVPVSIEEVLTQ